MLSSLSVLLALVFYLLRANAQVSGTGKTTRYWDCCKPSCSWPGSTSPLLPIHTPTDTSVESTLATGSNPVTTCDIQDNPLPDYGAVSSCEGGGAYMCSNLSPWAVSPTLAYGYAATTIAGGSEDSWCCACYALTFTSGAVAGKTMIVQAVNTGGDLEANQFDINIPGGGWGLFDACVNEFGTPSTGWGAQYGGIASRSDCDAFPTHLQDGCYWRFDWLMGTDNPTVSFTQVACPAALTDKSGCIRADDGTSKAPTGAIVAASSFGGTVASSLVAASSGGAVVASSIAASTHSVVVASTGSPIAVSSVVASSGGGGAAPVAGSTHSVIVAVELSTLSVLISSKTTTSTASTINTVSGKPAVSLASSNIPTISHYGQCGGYPGVYTGSTTCETPYKCVYNNPYFSQCL